MCLEALQSIVELGLITEMEDETVWGTIYLGTGQAHVQILSGQHHEAAHIHQWHVVQGGDVGVVMQE